MSDEEMIRRCLIQWLAAADMGFSALQSRLYRRLTELAAYERILQEVADFHAPQVGMEQGFGC